jgi:hypothetical protein
MRGSLRRTPSQAWERFVEAISAAPVGMAEIPLVKPDPAFGEPSPNPTNQRKTLQIGQKWG